METNTKELLTCSTCGDLFEGVWDPNMEPGMGNCPECEEWIGELTEDMFVDIKKKVAANLNEKNREKFLSMSKEAQNDVILKLVDKGVLKWKIVPGPKLSSL